MIVNIFGVVVCIVFMIVIEVCKVIFSNFGLKYIYFFKDIESMRKKVLEFEVNFGMI